MDTIKESITSLQKLLDSYDSIEDKLCFLERTERQKYEYYCYCGSRFSQEEANEYHKTWNWLIGKLNCLKAEELQQRNKG